MRSIFSTLAALTIIAASIALAPGCNSQGPHVGQVSTYGGGASHHEAAIEASDKTTGYNGKAGKGGQAAPQTPQPGTVSTPPAGAVDTAR